MAQRLVEVLKMAPKAKWAFFGLLASNRTAPMLVELKPFSAADKSAIAAFVRLLRSETQKLNFEHVVTLISVIRYAFLDSEEVFKAFIDSGLEVAILNAFTELRKKNAACETTPLLERMLANSADLFEWDIFGSRHYRNFMEQLLLVLSYCDDCEGSLYPEAASVMLAMCSTDIERVCSALMACEKVNGLFEVVLHNLPRAKSFLYQALLLEIIYRLQRHLAKSKILRSVKFASRLVSTLPIYIAQAVTHVAPKNFRDETRQLLNAFNRFVGVIQSFRVESLECFDEANVRIEIGEATWIDIGGVVMEAEIFSSKGLDKTFATMKLPYNRIRLVETDFCARTISLTAFGALCSVIQGIDDDLRSQTNNFKIVMRADAVMVQKIHRVIESRRQHVRGIEPIGAEGDSINAGILAIDQTNQRSSQLSIATSTCRSSTKRSREVSPPKKTERSTKRLRRRLKPTPEGSSKDISVLAYELSSFTTFD